MAPRQAQTAPTARAHSYKGGGRRRRTKRKFSQASTRRPITLSDQHGREWTAQVGMKTGMPTGRIVPSFSAPWYPDSQYLKVNPDNTAELFIDYKALLNRRRARLKEYHTGATQWAQDHKVPAPTMLGEYSDQIRRGYGAPPKPIEPIIAAMQGNKWILGLTTKVDPRLERFVLRPQSEDALLADYDFRDETDIDGDAGTTGPAGEAATLMRFRPRRRETGPLVSEDEGLDAFELEGGTATETTNSRSDAGATTQEGDEGDGGPSLEEVLEQLENEPASAASEELEDEPELAPRAPRGKKTGRSGQRASGDKGDKRPTLADGAKPAIADL